MKFSPDSRWAGPKHSRAPTQIREVAQFEASQQHSSNSPRWSQSSVVVVVVVVEWLNYSKRIIIVRWADLSDFFR